MNEGEEEEGEEKVSADLASIRIGKIHSFWRCQTLWFFVYVCEIDF